MNEGWYHMIIILCVAMWPIMMWFGSEIGKMQQRDADQRQLMLARRTSSRRKSR